GTPGAHRQHPPGSRGAHRADSEVPGSPGRGGGRRMTGFADHFSRDSSAYAKFRPVYPPELFQWLATLPARQSVAWDCGTGTGQAATMLTPYFTQVIASDASRAQIKAADRS